MSDTASDTLLGLEGAVGLHRKKTGWLPIYLAAALGFAFVIGFGDQTAGTLPRVVLGLGGAAVAGAIVLIGQIILTLRGQRRFPYLEEMPTHAALEEEKAQVLSAIKEIDFDHDMNKIDDRDYQDLRARYEAEALRVLKAIDDERQAWEKKAVEVARGHLASAGLSLSPVPGLRKKRDAATALEVEAPKKAEQKKNKKRDDKRVARDDASGDGTEGSAAASAGANEAASKTPSDAGQDDKQVARDDASENATDRPAPASAGKQEAAAPAPSDADGLTCRGCGRDNDADAVFCVGCGTRLVVVPRTCPACDTENEADARFCKRCGTKLEEARA